MYKLFKKLEKVGLIKPHYFIKKGNELIETDTIKTSHISSIHYTTYTVKNVPGEKSIQQKLKGKKKLKSKNTVV